MQDGQRVEITRYVKGRTDVGEVMYAGTDGVLRGGGVHHDGSDGRLGVAIPVEQSLTADNSRANDNVGIPIGFGRSRNRSLCR